MNNLDFLGNIDIKTLEALYQQYLKNPEYVEESWQQFFKGFEFARQQYGSGPLPDGYDKEFKVINLIEGYRRRGHLFTETNPVRARRKYTPTLAIENFGLKEADLKTKFLAGKHIGIGTATLEEIISHLKQTYCRSIGAEYLYIRNPEIVEWLKAKMEPVCNTSKFSREEKKHIYYHLVLAVGFEKFLQKKFVGQKSFSLEGAETLIPALDAVIEKGSALGIEEFIIGMSHRGRLNTLANILQKPYENIFSEFHGKFYEDDLALGDVKYHLGYENTVTTDTGKKIKLKLVPNPSHLESVDPVAEGLTRARMDRFYDCNNNRIAPILIHGDAAIASQGVVYEVIQMVNLPGYQTGGSIHLVINNQVGFTTNYLDARSSTYCTDIGKVTKAPVFHVNGDDVEALIYTVQLAMEFRQKFHSDVFIDILCYRKHGHNEGDEPRFTQPTLYKAISKHPNPRDIYAKTLVEQGVYSVEDIKQAQKDYDDILEEKFALSKKSDRVHVDRFLHKDWKNHRYPEVKDLMKSKPTGFPRERIGQLALKINQLPEDKMFFRKLVKLLDERKKNIAKNRIDWAMGELLAYATLLTEGIPVRISGQDSVRGTFSHRHAAYIREDTGEPYYPLKYLDPEQASFEIYNSPLSEYGVMGFEYGYGMAHPGQLVIWEAQFGDFHNVAQVIVDQYISSAEEKWGLLNGLVLYLPHGFEGQGPDHSSARIERFLSMAAEANMHIVNPTTPANLFHLLRNHVKTDYRLPLIVFTPKSLLRHPMCISAIEDLEKGSFRQVIDDNQVDTGEVRRVVFCSGKVYYDLLKRKNELNARDVALVRIEQLHPFPVEQIKKILKKYKKNMLTLYVQEEPENMGAWRYVRSCMDGIDVVPVARLASGSPASGLQGIHNLGQEEIVGKVFRKCTCELKNVYCGLQCVEGKSRKEVLDVHKYIEMESKFSI
ncbi:MAG: 2-oxoglutarate dehydrogenase E1 component [Chlorobi bacterium]|nr:2-oxoglutarate dehydrogenase E1 component [Chlorobiota bacterium]